MDTVSQFCSRRDRPGYSSPGCDVAGANPIGVGRKTTARADEIGLRLPIRLVDATALRARSARVARVHCDETHARERGLVRQERTQLEERPRVQRAPLGLPDRYPIADAVEVFDGNAASGALGLTDEMLADAVVGMAVEVLLLSSKLSEVSIRGFRAPVLERLAELGGAVSGGVDGCSRVALSVGVDRDVSDTKIDAEPSLWIDRATLGYFDGNEEKQLALAIDQIGLASNALESPAMVRTDCTGDDDSAVNRKQADAVEPVLEGVDTLVVGDSAMRLEYGQLGLVALVDLADLRDGSNGVLRREAEALSKLPIVEMLQVDLVGAANLESALCKPRTGFVDTSHGGEEPVAFGIVDEQLHGCDELHGHKHITSMARPLVGCQRPRFLPGVNSGASARSAL